MQNQLKSGARDRTPADAPAHSIHGRIIHGDKRGRKLGFPTANIQLNEDNTPPDLEDGVWTSTFNLVAEPSQPWHVAVTSVGRRETYYGSKGQRLLESNLLNFQGNLYGATVRVDLYQNVRPQRAFRNSIELVEQLNADVACTRVWAATNGLGHKLAPLVSDPKSKRGIPKAKRHKSELELHEIRERRSQRADALIAEALLGDDLHRLSYDDLAKRTRLPIGYLRWKYPTLTELHLVVSNPRDV